MSSRQELEQSLAGLESQRALLGDAIVNPAIAAIQLQLAALDSSPKSKKQHIHNELNLPHHAVEGWAGMVQLYLVQGDYESGQHCSAKILANLQENPQLGGTESKMRTFQFTWQALVALGKTAEADTVLTLAAAVMQTYLDNNRDPASQKRYLSQPHHRVLWAAWMER